MELWRSSSSTRNININSRVCNIFGPYQSSHSEVHLVQAEDRRWCEFKWGFVVPASEFWFLLCLVVVESKMNLGVPSGLLSDGAENVVLQCAHQSTNANGSPESQQRDGDREFLNIGFDFWPSFSAETTVEVLREQEILGRLWSSSCQVVCTNLACIARLHVEMPDVPLWMYPPCAWELSTALRVVVTSAHVFHCFSCPGDDRVSVHTQDSLCLCCVWICVWVFCVCPLWICFTLKCRDCPDSTQRLDAEQSHGFVSLFMKLPLYCVHHVMPLWEPHVTRNVQNQNWNKNKEEMPTPEHCKNWPSQTCVATTAFVNSNMTSQFQTTNQWVTSTLGKCLPAQPECFCTD